MNKQVTTLLVKLVTESAALEESLSLNASSFASRAALLNELACKLGDELGVPSELLISETQAQQTD